MASSPQLFLLLLLPLAATAVYLSYYQVLKFYLDKIWYIIQKDKLGLIIAIHYFHVF